MNLHTPDRRNSRTSEDLSVAVSRLSVNYAVWLDKLNPGMKIADFAGHSPGDFAREIQSYAGLLLTGGGDIHPRKYGGSDIQGYCIEVDEKRDLMEWEMTRVALEHGIPVLAICRGMQMLNIVRGGNLITDIPAFISNSIPHKNHQDISHPIAVAPGSLLHRITGCKSGLVNSSHHQAVDRTGEGMSVTACSSDGIAEAIESINGRHEFCIGVQWHPERMDVEDPFSGRLGRAFFAAALRRGQGTRDEGQVRNDW